MDIVTLRTGREVPAPAIQHTTVQLMLLERTPAYLYELLAYVRRGEEPSHGAFAKLQQLRLLDRTGNIHDVTRDIVLASYVGDEQSADLARVNPISYRAGGAE